MELTLESFRAGVQRAPVDVTGTGTTKKGFLVYSETAKGGLKLLKEDLETKYGGEYNGFVRSQLLKALRDSLSASNHSGALVDEFLRKAQEKLFGPIGGVTVKAFQKLECATVQELLEKFDSKFGRKSNGIDIAQIKRNLKKEPKKSVPKKLAPKISVPKNSGGIGSIGTAGSQKASGAGKPKIDISEWEILDIPQDKLTTAQRELRANCPNATPRQRAAVLKLDTEFPRKELGISWFGAKGLKVGEVRPSEIEGFVECRLVGPNGTVDVLVDQAGVCSRKDRLSKEQVEADYQALAKVLEKANIVNTVGGSLDVAKVFAHSELKIVADLVGVLSGLDARYDDICSVDPKGLVIGVLLNKLAPALGQQPHALKSLGSPEKNVVACWNMLKLPEPAPNAKDPALAVKFLDGLKLSVFNDYMKAMKLGPNIQADSSFEDDYRVHFMNFFDEDEVAEELGEGARQKVIAARKRIGNSASSSCVTRATTLILNNAGVISGLTYDARLKCMSDPHYVPRPHDFILMPKLNFSLDESLKTAFNYMNGDIGKKDGRYCNVTFTLKDGEEVSEVWPGLDKIADNEVDAKFEELTEKLEKTFNKEQIVQLAHYLNDSAQFVTGMGMEPSASDHSGELLITKDKNGDMKVVFKRPSRRLSGIDKTCGTITYQMCETTDDYVHRFTIGSNGLGKTDSIKFEKNPNRSEDVTLYNGSVVSEGQKKFLDDMAKDSAKALGLDKSELKSKAKGLVLLALDPPDVHGVSLYSFQNVDEKDEPIIKVKVKVDANGRIQGEPEIEDHSKDKEDEEDEELKD